MSDSENDSTVLGKRERVEQPGKPPADAPTYDDQSDEDIGPMPMPSNTSGTVKKKRKSEYVQSTLATRPRTYLSVNQSFHMKSYISSISQMQISTTSLSCTGTRSAFAS